MNQFKKRLRLILFSILSTIIFFNVNAQSNNLDKIKTVSGQSIETDLIDNRIQYLMDSIQIPGLSIAIINDAKVVYYNTFGIIDVETKTLVTNQTIFEAASLSKPTFAYFMMKMVEQGKLDLDQPIYTDLKALFSPEIVDSASLSYYKMITPRMVLSHSTGLPNWAKGKPLNISFQPGNGFSYSGEAYQHLAAALGTKLDIGWGKPLDSLFLKEVAQPLKMDNSFYVWNKLLEEHKAKGHQNGKINTDYFKPKNVGAAYSLHSEALDYAQFLIEMMEPQNLSMELIQEMLKTQNFFKEDHPIRLETGQTGWGLGFAQKPTPNGLMHLHTGNNNDFQAYAMFIPKQKYGLVVFVNSDNLFPFIEEIGKLIEEQF